MNVKFGLWTFHKLLQRQNNFDLLTFGCLGDRYHLSTEHFVRNSFCFQFYDTPSKENISLSNRLNEFLGSSLPGDFYTSHNYVTVRFSTDGSMEKSGFNLTYRAVGKNI